MKEKDLIQALNSMCNFQHSNKKCTYDCKNCAIPKALKTFGEK